MSGVDDGENKASQTGMMPIEWASVLPVIGSHFSPACPLCVVTKKCATINSRERELTVTTKKLVVNWWCDEDFPSSVYEHLEQMDRH